MLGQFGAIVIPPLFKSIFFGLFVFTIGYRSGPGFFASLSLQTVSQVTLALLMGACGLIVILIFAYTLHLGPGTAAGVGAGSLTQTSMMGTAAGALEQLGLSADLLKQEQADIAAGYAVTYICGYILVLLFVPFVAPRLMGVSLKEEAAKLEAALSGGAAPKPGNRSTENSKRARTKFRRPQAGRWAKSKPRSAAAPWSSAFSAKAKISSRARTRNCKRATRSCSPGPRR